MVTLSLSFHPCVPFPYVLCSTPLISRRGLPSEETVVMQKRCPEAEFREKRVFFVGRSYI